MDFQQADEPLLEPTRKDKPALTRPQGVQILAVPIKPDLLPQQPFPDLLANPTCPLRHKLEQQDLLPIDLSLTDPSLSIITA